MSAELPTIVEKSHSSHWTLWPRFLTFPVGVVVGHAAMVAHWGGESGWAMTAWLAYTTICWICVAGSYHEAAHFTLSRNTVVDLWYGRAVGTIIFSPISLFREVHRRHHAYLNSADDWELWPYGDPQKSRRFRRIFVWLDIVFAIVVTPAVYSRIYFVRSSRLPENVRRTIRNEYLGVLAFWSGVAAFVIVTFDAGVIEWQNFEPIWLLPPALAASCNSLRKLTEHLGYPTGDPMLGTRTILAINPITRLFVYFDFDLAVHGPHHRFPKLDHARLRDAFDELQKENADKCPLFNGYLSAFFDTLPWIVSNPAVGENVSNSAAP